MLLILIILGKGVRKGEKLKALYYANAAATRDYITAYDIIPNTNCLGFFSKQVIKLKLRQLSIL